MSPTAISPLSGIKALLFDVFGTVVDWRTSVAEELTLRAYRKRASPDLAASLKARLENLSDDDWGRFAQEWRNTYSHFTRTFNPETDTWKTIDQHHRDSLISLLDEWELPGLYSDSEIESLSLVWHRLTPWPDSVDGLAALSSEEMGLTTATLSNGNLSLLRDLADFGGLTFDNLFSAEQFQAYKPNPATYLGAVTRLGEEPEETAMVAAHLGDLQSAKACGLRTIYVARPGEESWEEGKVKEARSWVDLWVNEKEDGLCAVARKLKEIL